MDVEALVVWSMAAGCDAAVGLVRCERDSGHEGDHEATFPSCEVVEHIRWAGNRRTPRDVMRYVGVGRWANGSEPGMEAALSRGVREAWCDNGCGWWCRSARVGDHEPHA